MDAQSTEYIYSITNTANGRRYIGSTANLRTRCQSHRCALRRQKHYVPALQAEWNAYGEGFFRFERIAIVPQRDAGNQEAAWMAWFHRHGVELYNQQPAHLFAIRRQIEPSSPLPSTPDVVDLDKRLRSLQQRKRSLCPENY